MTALQSGGEAAGSLFSHTRATLGATMQDIQRARNIPEIGGAVVRFTVVYAVNHADDLQAGVQDVGNAVDALSSTINASQ